MPAHETARPILLSGGIAMKRLLLAWLALAPIACGNTPVPSEDDDPAPEVQYTPVNSLPTAAEAPKGDVEALVKGNNEFALDLYHRLHNRPGNLILSPYSLSAALGMTSAGARGETLKEMTTALHFPEQDRLHPAFATLIRKLNNDGTRPGPELSTANALWGQIGGGFLPDFLRLTTSYYGASLTEVDFARDTEGARKAINAWGERATNGKVPELLNPETLSADTKLVLTNAIHFRGRWATAFKKSDTAEGSFTLASGETVRVPLMHQQAEWLYHENDDFQYVVMPYVGRDVDMILLLPRKHDGLPALEKDLTASRLDAIIGKPRGKSLVKMTLPRFKTTAAFSLKEELGGLGMKCAFSPDHADFSGLNGGRPRLHLEDVVHEALLEIDEKGTKAAASTAVVSRDKGDPPKEVEFRADHPFLFLIRDNRSGTILFLGRITDPTK
jgi:serpin B